MKSDQYFVYITTNHDRHTVLYVGMTSDLARRAWQHQHRLLPGFTKRYNAGKLLYFEVYQDPNAAIARERQIKRWRRSKKEGLIRSKNPAWEDLSETL
ncbi:MAG: GIY-YIG nuclease family protein [Patescibacteria group bacterium]